MTVVGSRRAPAVEDLLPLTPLQEGLLFHRLRAKGSGVYFQQVAFDLNGRVDEGRLRDCWRRVVNRHAALRCAIGWRKNGQALMRVMREVEVPWLEEDLRSHDAGAQTRQLEQLLAMDIAADIDIQSPPLMRLRLIRLADDHAVLVWSVDHLLVDGWSMANVFAEVARLYGTEAVAGGAPPRLPAPADYRRFVAFHKRRDRRADESYFQARLADFDAPTPLPFARHHEASGHGSISVSFDDRRTTALKGFCQELGITANVAVVGAWSLLLGRFGGQRRVVIGQTLSGRSAPLPDIEAMVGLLINTLPVRLDLDDSERVGDWLRRLHREQADLTDHEAASLVTALKASGVPQGTPLFESLFVFENHPLNEELATRASTSGLAISLRGFHELTNYPLSLTAVLDDRLTIELKYARERFSDAAARRLRDFLDRALREVAMAPDRPVGAIELLEAAEREQVLHGWNDTGHERSLVSASAMFEAQVDRTRSAVALRYEAEELSYGELDGRANQLAHFLKAEGLGYGDRVALCLDRTVEMVVSLLGVLKAGCAYVPLDPEHPSERLRWVVEDAGASLVLTQAAHAESLSKLGVPLVAVDEDERWRGCEEGRLGMEVAPGAAMYVLYTSGSTGQPKGVVVPHEGVVNRLEWMQSAYGLTSDDVVLQKTPYTFDVSGWEFHWPLWFGAQLAIAPPFAHKDPEALSLLIRRHRVTTLHFVPSMLVPFLSSEGASQCTSIRRVICSGEALLAEHRDRFFEVLPASELHNLYGPTEASIDVSYHACHAGEQGAVPIGAPVWNTELYVADRDLRPVPVGVAGELLIGGVQLAQGYAGRASLTAERFIPDPYGSRAGGRLYRTGDLSRWRSDGELEYLGRLDHQVKIRGLRIELGEIESALTRHGSVRHAVVVARDDERLGRRLVAYVAADEGATAEELRGHLSELVPDYMVPSAFVLLEELPLNASGKVDRKALPDPPSAFSRAAHEPPRDEREQVIAEVYAAVLGLDGLGREDDFFALGGDSILVMQVAAQSRGRELAVDVRDVYEYPRVKDLAKVAGQRRGRVEAEQGRVEGDAQLTPAQRWLFEQGFGQPDHFNQSVLLGVDQPATVAAVESALGALFERHDALRLRSDGLRAWHDADGPQLKVTEAEVASFEDTAGVRRACITAQGSLSLAKGPLVAALLLRDRAGVQRLFIVVHHFVVDGVSWRVLLSDLDAALGAVLAGKEVALPDKTTSWKAWSERLWSLAETIPEEERAYWWNEASAAREALQRVPEPTGAREHVSAELDASATAALLGAANDAFRTTPMELLLGSFLRAVSSWAGGREVAVTLEGHGRESGEVADVGLLRTVGWFTTFWPLALVLTDDPLRDLCAVKEKLRRVPRRGLGYGLLRYGPNGAAAAYPDKVLFNYLGQVGTGPVGDSGGQSTLRLLEATSDDDVAKDNASKQTLSANAAVIDGRMQLHLQVGSDHPDAANILMDAWRKHLSALVDACLSPGVGHATPIDFPLVELSQDNVTALERTGRFSDAWPLSPLQAGLLFHVLRDPDAPAYRPQTVLRLHGTVDIAVLAASFNEALARHPSQRAAIVECGGEWLQVVRNDVELPIVEHDASGLDDEAQWERVRAIAREERESPLETASPPMMRVAVVHGSPGTAWLIWTVSHLIQDGWSQSLLVQEVANRYRHREAGQPLPVAEDHSYRQYLRWLQGRDQGAAERFFRERFGDLEAATTVPFDRFGSSAMSEQSGKFSAEETRRLEVWCRAHGLTVSTLLQGAWALALGGHVGMRDVTWGQTSAGRPEAIPGIDRAVGLFINTLPVRATWMSDDDPVGWLRSLQLHLLSVRSHEDCRLADVHRWCGVSHGQALFDHIFVFENYPVSHSLDDAQPGGLALSVAAVHEETHYALSLIVLPGSEVELSLRYDQGRYSAQHVERLLTHVKRAALGLASDQLQQLGDLTLLEAAEREQVLHGWNDTGHERSLVSASAMFEAQVDRTRSAVALRYEAEELSYGELDGRANQLAHFLKAEGLGYGDRVALCLDRTVEMVVSLLGVLKAGCAYVPLDPEHPSERLRWVVEDAGASLVLTQAAHAESLSKLGVPLVAVDEDERWRGCEEGRLGMEVAPGAAMYVLYTSGSTGQPKGVVVPHEGVVNRLEWMQSAYGLTSDDVVLQKTPYTFDVSGWEFHWPLWFGAQLAIAPPFAHKDPEALSLLIRRHRVTTLHFVPSMLVPFLSSEGASQCTSIRRVICSGEALLAEHRDRFFEVLPASELHNLYGPTEASIDVSYHACHAGEQGAVPIGAPVWNTELYVADRDLRPVPVGVAGELLIGGVQLAQGYAGRASLTAERFIPDPYGSRAGGRLYRTGDLSRWRSDGELEYLGRLDHQVKIRGLRIELGEIESALTRHGSVRHAVVVARDDERLGRRLVAYVAADEGATAEELRGHLSELVPDYMVPSAFVLLEELPLNASGKVDRKALPDPPSAFSRAAHEPPRDEREAALVRIWRDILGREDLGIHDDFFLAGGHSLLATSLQWRTRQELDLDFDLAALFRSPTVAGLSPLLRARGTGVDLRGAASRVAEGAVLAAPIEELTFRLWRTQLHSPWRIARRAIRVPYAVDRDAMLRAVRDLCLAQPMLRARYRMRAGRLIRSKVSVEEVPWIDLEASNEEEATELVAGVLQEPLDLEEEGPIRLGCCDISGEGSLVFVSVDHIVVDAAAVAMLSDWLLQSYLGHVSGRPFRVPEPAVCYEDFAAWHRGSFEQEGRFWRTYLAGARPLSGQLAGDLHVTAAGDDTDEFRLNPAGRLSGVLTSGDAHRLGVGDAHAACCGAIAALGREWAATDDVTFANFIDLRTRLPGLTTTLGFLGNFTLLRMTTTPGSTPTEMLDAAHRSIALVRSHQHAPLIPLCYPGFDEIFRVMMNLIVVTPEPTTALSDEATTRIFEDPDPWMQYHLVFVGHLIPDESLKLSLYYDATRWSPGAANRLLSQWRDTIRALLNAGSGDCGELR